ncbi:hypothetical protein [Planctomicrobium piriforme]|uniref:Zinc ribbon domain-containing protein n=1 Tax=Planctomicrobium piriforme TaxID=1576369 RepID=A0A1I3NLS1_9PLAN|nr:hypothetical protein [Planctomicrobium piriforme]SFJ10102.1 hypothetical protein SAMN05421753_115136 [Planctomicrobium piriforme]
MEFRSCPACHASVLEENVDDCPFCGASMSGKPKAAAPKKPAAGAPSAKSPARPDQKKSAPATPAAGAKPAVPPATGRPAQRPAAAPQPESDDPFEVDTSALRRAVKLAPKPTKMRTVEVICPMCGTPGYMAPTDAGKDVHCVDPSCMVPVFKTKKPKVEEAPKVEPKNNRMLLIGGGVGVLVIGGIAAMMFLRPKPQDSLPPAPVVVIKNTDDDKTLVPEQNRIVVQTEAPPVTLPEIRKKSLELIIEKARQREKNRHAEYGTQQSAEAFAEAGDLTKAKEQLKRLQSGGVGVAYLQIQPLVDIGWRQLAGGQAAEAAQSAQQALSKSKNLPRSVRKTHDAAIALAALLVATGKIEDAQALIELEQDRTVRGAVSVFWRAAVDARTFNVEDESRFVWHLSMPEPMRVGVVETLVAHGQSDLALTFAATGTDAASQASGRAAWAGRITQLQSTAAIGLVSSAIQSGDFDAASQTQMWAAVADMALFLKDQATSKAALEKAIAALAAVQAPTSMSSLSKKEIYESEGKPFIGLPNPGPSHAAALAAANVAFVQLHMGQADAAWASLQKSLDFFRGMTPSPVATQARLEECQKQEASVRSELSRALNLGNNEERIRIAFNRYRQQSSKINDQAQNRFKLQVAILRAAAINGLAEKVWTLAQERTQLADETQREPYIESTLPSLILALAQADGRQELAASVKGAFPEKPLTPDPLDVIYATASQEFATGKYAQASDTIERAYRSDLTKKFPDQVDLIALQIGGRMQSARPLEETIAFIQNLYDQLIQEDLFLLLAGDSMRRGTAPQLWKLTFESRDLDALEFVALYRGFIAGSSGPGATAAPVGPQAAK